MKNSRGNIYTEIYQYKPFSLLQVTFWDNNEKISKHYKALIKILEEKNSKSHEGKKKINKITPELLTLSYKLLIDPKQREDYLTFLKQYYILAEPLSLQQLKNNYYNNIFPFYIFTIKIKEKQQMCDLTIDFIKKQITITYKEKLIHLIKSDQIITVNKILGTSISVMLKNISNEIDKISKEKNKNNSEFKQIEFEPELTQQIDIIYTLISYLAQKIEDNNFYKLLENDTYLPCGIILKAKILKGHQTKFLGKDDRYAVLGPNMAIIYKDEKMIDIRNIMPLFPFLMRVNFVKKDKTIIFKYPNREQSLSFYNEEHYIMWMTTLKEIFMRRINSKMDKMELLEVNEMKHKENIVKEIDIEIQCVQEEIKIIKNKLDKFKEKIEEKEKEKNEK